MDLKDVSKKYKIPLKAVYKLHLRGVIPDKLDKEHEKIIEHITHIWGKEEFLRMQISRINKKKRFMLIHAADLNKVEKYVLTTYFNAMDENKRLSRKEIASQVNTYLKVPVTRELFNTIERMRKKAYYMMERAKKDNLFN